MQWVSILNLAATDIYRQTGNLNGDRGVSLDPTCINKQSRQAFEC